ncbi:MAG TPA: iron-sulfur cluster assembly protein [Candidatus Limnocylindria bacterium]|jgi:metal-sulfur cluster biosynthetic enzyme/rhodanese-related sulfurtransferase|nr:iron-sulfur cluster assembly protein [Candidatus Limnocylindria bacterium]
MAFVVPLVAAVLAVVLWRLAARLRDVDRQVKELRLLRREIEELREELDRGLGVTRAHLAAVAAGEPPERDVILRGAPYRDVQPAEALAFWEKTPGLFVLDVRTPAEFASGHIPNAHLIPVDELEDHLGELPAKDTPMLVHCAAGGRSTVACQTLGERGWTRLLNLAGGLHAWPGPRVQEAAAPEPPPAPTGTTVTYRGGPVTEAQVVGAIRECYDPEIPLNIYDLGLIYGIDIDESQVAVKMTLTSEGCPSARTIPEDVKRKIAALGQPNVTVDVVWDPPWHPSRISPDGKQKLGLA